MTPESGNHSCFPLLELRAICPEADLTIEDSGGMIGWVSCEEEPVMHQEQGQGAGVEEMEVGEAGVDRGLTEEVMLGSRRANCQKMLNSGLQITCNQLRMKLSIADISSENVLANSSL